MRPLPILVSPAESLTRLSWLFSHLQQAYPVRFAGPGKDSEPETPRMIFADTGRYDVPSGCRALVYALGPTADACSQQISFTRSVLLDRRLHGRTLEERSLAPLLPLDEPGDVLALAGGRPVWVHRATGEGALDVVRLPGTNGLSRTMLWDNLQQYRFFFLLTLVHFLYSILREKGWSPPALRASLVVDDPNLRSRSYGYLRYPEVVRAARKHRFHLSVAVSPVDFPATSPGMADLFRRNRDILSLSIHGNNHTRRELLRPATEQAALPMLSQMMRRVEAFEKRFDLPVCRVVVPPNEMCSAAVLRVLRRYPVDAVMVTRPLPWLPGDRWTHEADPNDGMLCWQPADFVEGGSPIIRRSSIPNNMVFRAFLNQPVIRYHHHGRFAGTMEYPLAAAAEINSLGDVQWLSLGEIARSNFVTRRDGSVLEVRPFSRHVTVPISEDITTLQVDTSHMGAEEMLMTVDGERPAGPEIMRGTYAVKPGTSAEIRFVHRSPVNYSAAPLKRTPLTAFAHRRLGEALDRLKLRTS